MEQKYLISGQCSRLLGLAVDLDKAEQRVQVAQQELRQALSDRDRLVDEVCRLSHEKPEVVNLP